MFEEDEEKKARLYRDRLARDSLSRAFMTLMGSFYRISFDSFYLISKY